MQNYKNIYGAIIFSCLLIIAGSVGASSSMTWIGSSTPDVIATTETGDITLVIDNSSGDIVLTNTWNPSPYYVQINAASGNVDVIFTGTNGLVWNIDGNPANPTTFFLTASPGYTINFNLPVGGAALSLQQLFSPSPLLIIVSGGGIVNFNIPNDNGSIVMAQSFLYVLMAPSADGTYGQLAFNNTIQNGSFDGAGLSLSGSGNTGVGYLSSMSVNLNGGGTDVGYIYVDSSAPLAQVDNPAFGGQLFVATEDQTSFIISGCLTANTLVPGITDPVNGAIQLADINQNMPAGNNAVLKIVAPTDTVNNYGSFLVYSGNNTYPQLLSDPFLNLGTRTDTTNYIGSFNGLQRYGFILGNNGTLVVDDGAYVIFYSTAGMGNSCPSQEVPGISNAQNYLKLRNASAFIVDGYWSPQATPAKIQLGSAGNEESALYFGSWNDSQDGGNFNDYVWPQNILVGPGTVIFDIEAPLLINGFNTPATAADPNSGIQQGAIELLSLNVQQYGGELFVGDGQINFLERTFTTTTQTTCETIITTFPMTLQKACMLVNTDQCYFVNSSLIHNDVLHYIKPKDSLVSEPTYVGGETWQLLQNTTDCALTDTSAPRPAINFVNGVLNVNTDIALTGVDLNVPNEVMGSCVDNVSQFIFYYNGLQIDQGNGRNMILGTLIGSQPCGATCCSTIVDDSAHLNVLPTASCIPGLNQLLLLQSAPNDGQVTEGISSADAIVGQYGNNDIYLANDTNVSIGTQVTPCVTTTCNAA